MAPTRCGSVAVADVLKYCEDKEIKTVKQLCTKNGGFVNHMGISDALELTNVQQMEINMPVTLGYHDLCRSQNASVLWQSCWKEV